MSDLIRREDAIDVLEILADKMSDEGKTVMAQAVAVLKDLQSEEPERKEGELKTVGFLTCQCSECGAQFHELEYTNFCPNCGTKWSE